MLSRLVSKAYAALQLCRVRVVWFLLLEKIFAGEIDEKCGSVAHKRTCIERLDLAQNTKKRHVTYMKGPSQKRVPTECFGICYAH